MRLITGWRGALIGMLAAAGLATPILAVGISPLRKDGATVGPAKAFYLTVINPYAQPMQFVAYLDGRKNGSPAAAQEGGQAQDGVVISPARMTIKGGGQRRILVLLKELAPGSSREARVCAELAQQKGMINARVCSTLVAHRVFSAG